MHANHAIRSLAILLLMTTVATCPAWAVNSTRITEFAAGYPRSTTGKNFEYLVWQEWKEGLARC